MTEMIEQNTNNDSNDNTQRKYSHLSDNNNKKDNIFKSLSKKLKLNKTDDDISQDHHATNKFDFKYEHKSDDMYIYDKSVDVFSFGIMMFEIGFLIRVYIQMDLIEIYDMICGNKRLAIPKYNTCQNAKLNPKSGFYMVSEAVYEAYIKLMKECWAQNPNDRPTFSEIIIKLKQIESIRYGNLS
eukprot:554916_1